MSTNYVREFIKEVKNLTELIDFGCDCFERQVSIYKGDTAYSGSSEREMVVGIGCCISCRQTLGYAALNDSTIGRFDDRFGFWREGKGCILERWERSNICLLYSCKTLDSESSGIRCVITSLLAEARVPTKSHEVTNDELKKLLDESTSYNRMRLKQRVRISKPKIRWPALVPLSTRRKIMRLRRLAIKQLTTEE